MPSTLEAGAFERARERIGDDVHRTPVFSSRTLGERLGASLFLKCENLQKTGAFKVRGALNRVRSLDVDARARGVVTISAGNHAQALAWAATAAGVPATVVMPESAPRSKVDASAAYGAEVVLHGDVFAAFEKALELAEERNLVFVHPFDDEAIVAGQGTVALEVLEQLPEIASVVVPVGGGGLLAGICTVLAHRRPEVRVYGVEPTGADAMRRSLDDGGPVRLDQVDTIADGLGAPMAGEITLEHIRAFAEDVVTVTDAEIARAMALILSRAKLLTEPAGAAGVAALLAGKIPDTGGGPAVAVLSGGNVDLDVLPELLALGA